MCNLLLCLLLFLNSIKVETEEPRLFEKPFLGDRLSREMFYFGSGIMLGGLSQAAQAGYAASRLFWGKSRFGNECLLLCELCRTMSNRLIAQRSTNSNNNFLRSWDLNERRLSQVPAETKELQEQVNFLKMHWLSKANGFYRSEILAGFCFDIDIQVHPKSSNCYIRDPASSVSIVYQQCLDVWKKSLPHPLHFPLILTRPFNIGKYLKYISVDKNVIDLTHLFQNERPDQWMRIWNQWKEDNRDCKGEVVCVQRLVKGSLGGIRILCFDDIPNNDSENGCRFLLEWISHLGLSANQIELNRFAVSPASPKKSTTFIQLSSKKQFVQMLNDFNSSYYPDVRVNKIIAKGIVSILIGFLNSIDEKKWENIACCPTRSSVVELALRKIKDELNFLVFKQSRSNFYESITHLEEIHAHTTSLLEIFSPAEYDFPQIYFDALTTIPEKLKPMTVCAIHSCAMASSCGIYSALQEFLGGRPKVIYGENTYFENVYMMNRIASAVSIEDATEEDYKNADLLFAQFNPVWKRGVVAKYSSEDISTYLRKALKDRQKPLIAAIDSTIDYFDSPRMGKLLEEFQDEVKKGILNIICIRSGLKFDIFGMDNYCGAPLYMIHNQDQKWAPFDVLLKDPALLTDSLSRSWFAFAFKNAPEELQNYQKQIFKNTRELLNKIPEELFDANAPYRVIPFDAGADPAFIDIQITGPMHLARGAALVAGSLYLQSMERKHPIFYRRSIGFYHPNFGFLDNGDSSTLRLTLGLDPSEVDLFSECFQKIRSLIE